MNIKEFIEESMFRRLSDKSRDKMSVSPTEFNFLLDQMREMMSKMAKRVSVEGVSEEDMLSFYAMKTHQVLRRGGYDRTKPPRVLFYVAFSNLNRDVKRLEDVAKRKNLDEDAFDHSFGVDTQEKEIYVSPPDKHPLDVAIERLSQKHGQIIKITLDRLDSGDDVLVPLAKDILDFWL